MNFRIALFRNNSSSLLITVLLIFVCNTAWSNFNSFDNSKDAGSKEQSVPTAFFGSLSDESELIFSHDRRLYDTPFELTITSNNSDVEIFYTMDCSVPSAENGFLYNQSILIDSTKIIKAIAISGTDVSQVYTNTYIFPASTANQGKSHHGFPETWGGAKIIPADYEMDPEVINDPDYSSEIIEAFKSIPSLSLTMDTDEWFNHETGLYVGYKNTNITREKPVTAEFIFNSDEESFSIECGVQNQGGTSIVKWKSPKQSMRLLFKEQYGPTRLRRKLFPDSEINSINTLVVDALLNQTWIHPTDDRQRVSALYFRDQLTSDLQNEMGWLSYHGRYFHLYLNGLYWGICDLHERPDDAFLSEYLDAEREAFDVVKHNPDNVVSGSNDLYLALLNRAQNEVATNQGLKDIQVFLDLPAFIDYMILNFYLGNQDWAHQNYYAAKNRTTLSGFRFYTWDAEHVIRFSNVNYDNTEKDDEGGPTGIHTFLKTNEEYRLMFADAVYKHMFNDGVLTPEKFEKSFNFRAEEIEKAIILESARWGDYREGVSSVTYTKNDYWVPEVNKVLEDYIPRRRDIVIEQFRRVENKLFPKYMPPVIEDEDKINGNYNITLIDPNYGAGSIYFTTDGSDPRSIGGGIYGTKYAGKIAIGNSTILKARYYSETDKTWSALAEEIYLFDEVYGEKVVINEIMYHPDSDYPEFIEIMNLGSGPVNLNGFAFSGGINYNFKTDQIIQPGAGLVLSDNVVLFKIAYDFNAFAQYEKQLSNSGETVLLTNVFNQLVDSVAYSDSIPWPEAADGSGYSLELNEGGVDNSLPGSWHVSDKKYGTPYKFEAKLDLDVAMYPNPFSDNVTVVFDNQSLANGRFTIEVFNQLGSKVRTIYKTSYNSKVEFSLADLYPGLYLIKVNSEDSNQFKGTVLKAIKLN